LTQPGNWSPEFNNFIKRCLTIDNKQRPTTKELLLDPFIDKHIVSKRGTQPTKTGKKPSKGAYGRAILR
jgi:serine/threonine kinase 4